LANFRKKRKPGGGGEGRRGRGRVFKLTRLSYSIKVGERGKRRREEPGKEERGKRRGGVLSRWHT